MTAHTHTVLTDGCYRCELHRDEIQGYLSSLMVTRSGVVHDPDCSYVSGITSTATSWAFSGQSANKVCKVCLPDGLPTVGAVA